MNTKRNIPTLRAVTDDAAEFSRDLWLAGLGAIAAVEERGTKLYDDMVEWRKAVQKDGFKRLESLQQESKKLFDDLVVRGEKLERQGRKQLEARIDAVKGDVTGVRKGLKERRKELTGKVDTVADKLEKRVAGTVETVLERLEVPTRKEVQSLAAKVDRLADKVNALTALLAKEDKLTTTVFHVVPREEDWAVKQEGVKEPITVAATKTEVLEYARDLAKAKEPSRLVIHRKDGTIQDQVTYQV